MRTGEMRDEMLQALGERGVHAVFHYLPLHGSPGGQRFGRLGGPVPVTIDASGRLLRLPLWAGLGEARTQSVIDAVKASARIIASSYAY
jgi:dTDP-4-amino-4,6-dideoxygalactose transaminase